MEFRKNGAESNRAEQCQSKFVILSSSGRYKIEWEQIVEHILRSLSESNECDGQI